MDIADYRSLVASLEAVAQRDPRTLRRRVYGLITLGYGYVLVVLAGLIGLTGAVIAIMISTRSAAALWKAVFGLLVATGIVARALWVKVAPPAGRPLRRDEAPVLFDRVETLRAALDAPAPTAILLDESFNASVSSVPRLGIFGWPRTYLTIGLPLVHALTPAQFDAVLAHEFGHLSGSHPKHGLWVHRVGHTWQRLIDDMVARESVATWLFARFFRWFIPRLNAYGYVMSRADEYAADADAARVTDPAAIGGALAALEVRGKVLAEDFWSDIWAQARTVPDPPAEAWQRLPRDFRERDAHEGRAQRLAVALRADVGDLDTHPPLRDRLRALALLPADGTAAEEAVAALLTPLEETAADRYLGAVASRELSALDEQWRRDATDEWRRAFAAAEARRQRIAALESKDRDHGLEADDLRALLLDVVEDAGDDAAAPIARRLLAAQPSSAEAHFYLGRSLVNADVPEGVELVRRAMVLDRDAVMPGARVLYAYYERQENGTAMTELEAQFDARRDELAAAKAERQHVTASDRFTRPVLDEPTLAVLRDAATHTPGVARLLVTAKVTAHDPERPLLIVVPTMSWRERFRFRASRRDVPQELVEACAPLDMLDLLVASEDPVRHKALAKRLAREDVAIEVRPGTR